MERHIFTERVRANVPLLFSFVVFFDRKNVKADSQEVAEKKYLIMRVGTVLAAAAVLEIVMIPSSKNLTILQLDLLRME